MLLCVYNVNIDVHIAYYMYIKRTYSLDTTRALQGRCFAVYLSSLNIMYIYFTDWTVLHLRTTLLDYSRTRIRTEQESPKVTGQSSI